MEGVYKHIYIYIYIFVFLFFCICFYGEFGEGSVCVLLVASSMLPKPLTDFVSAVKGSHALYNT